MAYFLTFFGLFEFEYFDRKTTVMIWLNNYTNLYTVDVPLPYLVIEAISTILIFCFCWEFMHSTFSFGQFQGILLLPIPFNRFLSFNLIKNHNYIYGWN